MKILIVTTISNTIGAFLIPHIDLLVSKGFKVDLACRIEKEIGELVTDRVQNIFDIPFTRKPFSKSNLIAYKKIKSIIEKNDYDIIHVHTPVASAITRLANFKYKRPVLYTAHGFHFHKKSSLVNWILYYPIEKLLSRKTYAIITINSEDFLLSKNKLKAKKLYYIKGVGVNIEAIRSNVNQNYNFDFKFSDQNFNIISVGELNTNKNHSIILDALHILNDKHINYYICGDGSQKDSLKSKADDLGLSDQVHFLGFRTDVLQIVDKMDIFVFPSKREGLSVALMEAMVLQLPVICSNIRGNNDLIVNDKGGYLIDNNDAEGYSNAINILKNNTELRKSFGNYNSLRIQDYDLELVLKDLYVIYDEMVSANESTIRN